MSDSHDFSLMDLFREEARTHAAAPSEGLLALEGVPGHAQRYEPLMRAAHSIEVAGRVVGIDLAVRLAHVLEDVFVAAQNGRLVIGSADVDVFLRATDVL